VAIDEPRRHEPPASVDDAVRGRLLAVGADPHDAPALHRERPVIEHAEAGTSGVTGHKARVADHELGGHGTADDTGSRDDGHPRLLRGQPTRSTRAPLGDYSERRRGITTPRSSAVRIASS
jgi:hypothetical protein